MAKHRIRRWLQFGVLDLLIVTAIVAVGAVLWRPAQLYELVGVGATPGQRWSDNSLGMKFCWCPPGEFRMGGPPNQVDVKLSQGFWMGKYEVTQDEYYLVTNANHSYFPPEGAAGLAAARLPVENVTWDEAAEFCRQLTERERKAGRLPIAWEYRLPTEAQWEYACRSGTQTRYSFGDDDTPLGDFAWHDDNSIETHKVGQKLANAWGLHDMHGNVWEWCRDAYQATLVGGTDPQANHQAGYRVNRGGSYLSTGSGCQSASRNGYTPGNPYSCVGFRVALVQLR